MPNLQTLIFLAVLALSLGLFAVNARRLAGYLRIGKPESRSDRPGERLRNVLAVAFGQTKLLREPLAGLLHFFIFWGFVILLSAIIETMGEGVSAGFTLGFLGPLYPPLAFLQETIGVLAGAAALVALLRRFVAPPARLDVEGHSRFDAALVLLWILAIVLTMFGQNAANIAGGAQMANGARFVSTPAAAWFPGGEGAGGWFSLFWWAHLLLVLGFLNYLPYSKHLHVLSSVPNVFFAKLGRRGILRHLDLQDETAARFGAADVEDLTWKQLLDGYTCTECGRCTAACPAANTGKLLSPKKIVVDIRKRLVERAPALLAERGASGGEGAAAAGDADAGAGRQLVDGYITEEELWACTTCMACVQECPVQIEHVDAIVDMRRYLVLNESRFPKEMQATFQNLERNFTPWNFSHSTRADWAEGMEIPVLGEGDARGRVLFWVGCAGAYDARYTKVTRAFAKLMRIAGIDFAILGTAEKCTGDPARRAGNEYLGQMLMAENVATLNARGVRTIVTTCPHCFNMLLNEYPALGGRYEVIHHTEYLMGLVDSGKLRLTREQRAVITYHDSCYLGRYNGVYDEPRRILGAVPGAALAEMPRNRDRGFCCGAGGARMFMEETTGKRVNVERTEEALRLAPDVIGTACPFCMTMMTDGVKEKDAASRVSVRDVAEILLDAIEGNAT